MLPRYHNSLVCFLPGFLVRFLGFLGFPPVFSLAQVVAQGLDSLPLAVFPLDSPFLTYPYRSLYQFQALPLLSS